MFIDNGPPNWASSVGAKCYRVSSVTSGSYGAKRWPWLYVPSLVCRLYNVVRSSAKSSLAAQTSGRYDQVRTWEVIPRSGYETKPRVAALPIRGTQSLVHEIF